MGNGMASIMAVRKRSGFSPRRSAGRRRREHAGDHVLGGWADDRTRRVRRNLLDGMAVAAAGNVGPRALKCVDELAGGPFLVAVAPAPRPGAVEGAASPGLDPALAEGGGPDPTVRDGLAEDAPDGGDGQSDAGSVEHGLEAELAHERVLVAQLEHGLGVGSVHRRRRTVRGRVLLGLSACAPPRRNAFRQS